MADVHERARCLCEGAPLLARDLTLRASLFRRRARRCDDRRVDDDVRRRHALRFARACGRCGDDRSEDHSLPVPGANAVLARAVEATC